MTGVPGDVAITSKHWRQRAPQRRADARPHDRSRSDQYCSFFLAIQCKTVARSLHPALTIVRVVCAVITSLETMTVTARGTTISVEPRCRSTWPATDNMFRCKAVGDVVQHRVVPYTYQTVDQRQYLQATEYTADSFPMLDEARLFRHVASRRR